MKYFNFCDVIQGKHEELHDVKKSNFEVPRDESAFDLRHDVIFPNV